MAVQGWNPKNRNLLLHKVICATMTSQMLLEEKRRGLYPYVRLPLDTSLVHNTYQVQYQSQPSTDSNQLSFSKGGIAQYVANSIIGEVDKQHARDWILQTKTAAKTERERILAIKKKMTAGKLILEGRTFVLNKKVLEQAEQHHTEKLSIESKKHRKAEFDYLELC